MYTCALYQKVKYTSQQIISSFTAKDITHWACINKIYLQMYLLDNYFHPRCAGDKGQTKVRRQLRRWKSNSHGKSGGTDRGMLSFSKGVAKRKSEITKKCHVPHQLVALAGSRQTYPKRLFRFRYVLTWDGIGWGECCPLVWLIHSFFSTRLRLSLDTRNMEDACKTLINKNKEILPGVILSSTPFLLSGMSTLLTRIHWSMGCCWIF